jgi:hypothetical protein
LIAKASVGDPTPFFIDVKDAKKISSYCFSYNLPKGTSSSIQKFTNILTEDDVLKF